MIEGEKIESYKKLKLKCFSPLKILTSPFFEETLVAFFLFSIFVLLLFLSFFMLRLLRT
jgi:hypothetical protein